MKTLLMLSVFSVLGLLAGSNGADEPILLGRVGPGDILGVSPEWQQQFDGYVPVRADLSALGEAPSGSLLVVFFGSWCGDSREGVPRMLRILHDAPANRLRVRYYAVDRSKKDPSGAAAAAEVVKVPTFILKVHGREVGRIVETPETTLEHDLARMILKAAQPQAP